MIKLLAFNNLFPPPWLLLVEWRRLSLFPAKMTLAHGRALFSIGESRLRQTANANLYHVNCRLLFVTSTKKLLVSNQVYPKELFGTDFICSSLNLTNSQLAVCGKRGSKSLYWENLVLVGRPRLRNLRSLLWAFLLLSTQLTLTLYCIGTMNSLGNVIIGSLGFPVAYKIYC